jgi:ribosomal protein L16/L10AE
MKQFPNYKIYKKNHLVFYDKFRVNRKSFRVKYNNIGIQSKNTVYLDYKQLDSGRKILKKVLRKNGDLIVKFSP